MALQYLFPKIGAGEVVPSRPTSPMGNSTLQTSLSMTPCRTRLLGDCLSFLVHTVVAGPSQNRAYAIYAHDSSHSQFTEKPNILTLIACTPSGAADQSNLR